MKKIFIVIVVLLFVFSMSMPAFAGNDVWQGNVAGAATASANWNAGGNTTSGNSWEFTSSDPTGAAINNNLGNGWTVAGMTFDASSPAYTISGNSISLTGNINNNSSNNQTLNTFFFGNIINTGSGTGETIITGGINGAQTSTVEEDSATSALIISTNPFIDDSDDGNGTLIDDAGQLTVTGGVTGSGTLFLENNSSTGAGITLSGTSVDNTGAIENYGTGTDSTLISAPIGSAVTNVIEDSTTSDLYLDNSSNAYTGSTTITAGTLHTEATDTIPDTSNVSVANGATLDLDGKSQNIGSLSGAGTVHDSSATAATLTTGTDDTSTSFSGTITNGVGAVSLNYDGTGTFTLSGNNSYSGGTTISDGTLDVENVNALGTGAVTNNSKLILGTSLSINAAYTQAINSTLVITINSASSFTGITSTSHAAVVSAGSTIYVNVGPGAIIPNGTTFDIINTGGAGVSNVPTTVDSSSSLYSFTDSDVGGDLYLDAHFTCFACLADNRNAFSAGTVLDNIIANGSGNSDMTTVLNALGSSSSGQITAALNTLSPIVDDGVRQNSSAALDNFIGATFDRAHDVLTLASAGNSDSSGVSAGDESKINGLWAKQYGGYLDQGTRQGIGGYDAWNTGTVVGVDHMFDDNLILGASLGYAYGEVDSDVNSASTDMNSAQATLYGGYEGTNAPYFIDAAGSFANNWYDGQRDITVSTINRIADSSYQGQQSGAYLGGGYRLDLGNNLAVTPLTSLQWTHLSLDSYTESNAGALNLQVNRQSYNFLESALGASISYKAINDWGNLTPELHAKWLYDFIDDDMQVTSSFTGGGGAFTSYGASPAREGADIGGKLSFDFKNDVSIIAQLDTELKDQFFGIGGSVAVRYKF